MIFYLMAKRVSEVAGSVPLWAPVNVTSPREIRQTQSPMPFDFKVNGADFDRSMPADSHYCQEIFFKNPSKIFIV